MHNDNCDKGEQKIKLLRRSVPPVSRCATAARGQSWWQTARPRATAGCGGPRPSDWATEADGTSITTTLPLQDNIFGGSNFIKGRTAQIEDLKEKHGQICKLTARTNRPISNERWCHLSLHYPRDQLKVATNQDGGNKPIKKSTAAH